MASLFATTVRVWNERIRRRRAVKGAANDDLAFSEKTNREPVSTPRGVLVRGRRRRRDGLRMGGGWLVTSAISSSALRGPGDPSPGGDVETGTGSPSPTAAAATATELVRTLGLAVAQRA